MLGRRGSEGRVSDSSVLEGMRSAGSSDRPFNIFLLLERFGTVGYVGGVIA